MEEEYTVETSGLDDHLERPCNNSPTHSRPGTADSPGIAEGGVLHRSAEELGMGPASLEKSGVDSENHAEEHARAPRNWSRQPGQAGSDAARGGQHRI